MNWKLLGIEPTKDKKAITAAYRAQLQHTNPEDKPEEFKALRAAYEEALILADQENEEPVRDETPIGLWMEKVRQLYDDFQRRIQPDNWSEIRVFAQVGGNCSRDGGLTWWATIKYLAQSGGPVWWSSMVG